MSLFANRRQAGRVLARSLSTYAQRTDVLVLGLPRGGVLVAYEVALALQSPLDVFLVRKLGVPGREELALGAIASDGTLVLNDDIVREYDLSPQTIDAVRAAESRELLRRERLFRGHRPPADVLGKTVILVDDGLATGATMRSAVHALRCRNPARLIVAVPVAARSTCDELTHEVDEVICPATPEPFTGVGLWYDDFRQSTDEEVRDLLELAWSPSTAPAAPTA